MDIFNTITECLLQSRSNPTYSTLCQQVIANLDCTLSHRDFANCLQDMVDENIVNKVDKTGKRGSKIYYSLSENAMSQHQLQILKVDKDYETKRSIYQILLYFHSFKRGELLTQRQLNKKLHEFRLRFEDLQEIKNKKNGVTTMIGNIEYTQINAFTNSFKNIGVIKYEKKESCRIVKNNFAYYVYVHGFTITEFIKYIKKLKTMKEPRPFSRYPPFVPYIFYRNFRDSEIEDAIQLFHKARLIKIIPPIFVGEIRYYISDDSLIGLITMIMQIQEILLHKDFTKLTYIQKPDENDRQILELYFGKKGTDFTIAKAHQIRKSLRNQPNMQIEGKRTIQEYDYNIGILINSLNNTYENRFMSNELLMNLITTFPKVDQI